MTDPLKAMRTGSSNAGSQSAYSTNRSPVDQRVQNGIDYVNKHGGDPKTAAIQLLKERGIEIPKNPFALAMQILNGK